MLRRTEARDCVGESILFRLAHAAPITSKSMAIVDRRDQVKALAAESRWSAGFRRVSKLNRMLSSRFNRNATSPRAPPS